MDRENSCEAMQLFAPKTKQINRIFSGSPRLAPDSAKAVLDNYPGKNAAVGLSCSLPDYRHYSLPGPTASSCFVPPGCQSGSATGAEINGTGPDGCLPELDMFPPVAKLCVYGICAFVLRCFFSVLTLYSPMEHSLGVNFFFFSSLSPHVMLYFLPFPVFLFCLPRCHMYVVYVWTG